MVILNLLLWISGLQLCLWMSSLRIPTYNNCAYIIRICFSAHTKESAKALMDTIKMTFPQARLTLVVAMASDKDHLGFAREFLSGAVREFTFSNTPLLLKCSM